MRRKDETVLLRKIAGIRDLQRLAAEAQAARAAQRLRDTEQTREQREERHRATEAGWLRSLESPELGTQISSLWSQALVQDEVKVRRAAADVRNAAAELDRRAKTFHAASERSDTAHDLARESLKERVRRRDEAALQDAADRHAQRGSDT